MQTLEKTSSYNEQLNKYIEDNFDCVETFYIDLGVKIVRLMCYSEQFIPHIKKQLTYVLTKNISEYDSTIVLWQEDGISGTLISYDAVNDRYYYGVKNLEPEEFIKWGHIFVQILYKILDTDTTSLVHGACVGLNNIGVLLCARGQRGKSTLAVNAMLEGFEYVSDDYLTLEKEGENLFAYPIYSIITLSPRMYNELYDKLEGCRFISNNARKDKYVINIANYHSSFKEKYPIKLCMFPEITIDKEPSIQKCSQQEKGRAITHIIHSTLLQMNDLKNVQSTKKLINMVNNFDFYKINLCNDIDLNVKCLKNFIEEYEND